MPRKGRPSSAISRNRGSESAQSETNAPTASETQASPTQSVRAACTMPPERPWMRRLCSSDSISARRLLAAAGAREPAAEVDGAAAADALEAGATGADRGPALVLEALHGVRFGAVRARLDRAPVRGYGDASQVKGSAFTDR